MNRRHNSVDRTIREINPNLDGNKSVMDNVNESSIDGSDLHFETENIDYTAAEFYEIYRKDLPCLVVVDQGFCGDILEDTFDREQVILLKTLSAQKRVIGKMMHSLQPMWISLPVNYQEQLRVVKHGIAGTEKPLQVIMQESRLPCYVVFPEDRTIQVGATSRPSHHLPMIELTHTFDEMFFLGNNVNDGELTLNIFPVPLYLSELKFKLITGFTNKPKSEFTNFMGTLTLASSFLNYNIKWGNMNIAEYDTTAVQTSTISSFIQPNTYTDCMTFSRRKPVVRPRLPYRSIPSAMQPEVHIRTRDSTTTNEHKQTQSRQKGQGHASAPQHEAMRLSQSTAAVKQQFVKRRLSPLPHERAQNNINDLQPRHGYKLLAETVGNQNSFEWYPDDCDDPVREPKAEHATSSVDSIHIYETLKCKDKFGSYETPVNVRPLTVVEVGEYLTRLNLYKYRQAFRDNMIDGELLIELDTDLLTTNFGMKKIEALRLLKFAETGIIPS